MRFVCTLYCLARPLALVFCWFDAFVAVGCTANSGLFVSTAVVRAVVATVWLTVVIGITHTITLVAEIVVVVLAIVVVPATLCFSCCFFTIFLTALVFINSFSIYFNTVSITGELANKVSCFWPVTGVDVSSSSSLLYNLPESYQHGHTYDKHYTTL